MEISPVEAAEVAKIMIEKAYSKTVVELDKIINSPIRGVVIN